MQIKTINPENLIEYSFNNRIHSDEQIDLIANSIKEFGFNQPIVVDEDNIILVGHGRLKAAKKLGLTEVPYLKVEGLSETQKKAYRILDNKLQNDSTWDFANLNIELPALEADGFDLEAWGLDELNLKIGQEVKIEEAMKDWDLSEFKNDPKAFKSLHVHFKSKEDFEEFQSILKLDITEKTNYIWFPV